MFTTTAPLRASRPQRRPDGERIFYVALAGTMLAAVVIGFGRTYFMRLATGSPAASFPVTGLLHLHAGLFTAWVLLFMVQVGLVSANRRDLHRTLGQAGLPLVLAMILVGVETALRQLDRGSGPPFVDPRSWLAMPLAAVVGFGVLFVAGLMFRKTPGVHKRLMVLGMAAMLPSAFGRLPFIPPLLAILVAPNLYALALIGWDLVTSRRVHAPTVWGGLLVLATTVGPIFFWKHPAWLGFAEWLGRLYG